MAKKDLNINTAPVYDAIAEATTQGRKPRKTYTAEEAEAIKATLNTSGRKGVKLSRINVAFTPDNHKYVKTMARVTGITLTDFINKIIEEHRAAHADLYQQAIDFKNSL